MWIVEGGSAQNIEGLDEISARAVAEDLTEAERVEGDGWVYKAVRVEGGGWGIFVHDENGVGLGFL